MPSTKPSKEVSNKQLGSKQVKVKEKTVNWKQQWITKIAIWKKQEFGKTVNFKQ